MAINYEAFFILIFMTSYRWWQEWLEYVNQSPATNTNNGSSFEHHDAVDSSSLKGPSSIDNSDLLYEVTSDKSTPRTELHETLVEGTDFILLPQEVWNQFCAW